MSNKDKKSGIRVAHDFTDFVEDREIILTLKDSYILGQQDINDDIDVLENIHMAEDYKRQALQENRKKKDEFLEGKYGGEKKILPQYDEVKTEKDGIILDTSGEYNLEKIKSIESIKAKLSAPSKKGGEVSLDMPKNVASEYYTSDEMKKFKKPMKKAVNVQKNKEDILKLLEESMDDNSDNLGSRDSRKKEKDDLEDAVRKKHKTENYEVALEKAREQTKYANYLDEEYEDIQRAIENQRRAAQTGKANKVEDVVRTLIETSATANQTDNKETVVMNNVKKKPADAEFVELDTINTATDFLKTVSTKDDINQQRMKILEPSAKSIRDTRDGTTSVVNVALPSEAILAWNKANSGLGSIKPMKKETKETTIRTEKEEDEEIDKEEVEKLLEERKFIDEDQLTGLAATLEAIRKKGLLGESEVEISGRSNDKTYREELSKFKDNNDRVRLEYRDVNGRIMTPKEAFRYQCRIFHGIKPSKNKQEKERKKHMAAMKLLKTAPQESASMKALKQLQTQSNQPYVVLDTKNPK